jgi:hypothetical protein
MNIQILLHAVELEQRMKDVETHTQLIQMAKCQNDSRQNLGWDVLQRRRSFLMSLTNVVVSTSSRGLSTSWRGTTMSTVGMQSTDSAVCVHDALVVTTVTDSVMMTGKMRMMMSQK